MLLNSIDWIIIILFFILSLVIGLYAAKQSGKSAADFFLSGRTMPWWLLGISMVATTFSCDTPNLVTDIVRQNGVAGNWVWWAFLLTGMLTVFVYAKLWRRSKVMTDLEFYELRYSGKEAAFLRGFRAIYLGAFFNIMVIALVSLALIKIGAVMMQWSPAQTMIVAAVVTVTYSAFGGLRGIILTDFFQFIISMIGAIGAAVILINMPEIGGLEKMIQHPAVVPKLNMFPDIHNYDALIGLLVLPLLIQWWSVWYPGSEPGGGGYIAQRMLSAKNEKDAVKASLLFNITHYALRPWPWILVALASLIIFPDLESIRQQFPNVDVHIIKNDFAYPAMLSFLPNGFLGLVVAALIAAYMSTVSTQLNWGSSYIVNDFYNRFINKEASQKRLVLVGRLSTVALMILAGILALLLQNALQAFEILLQIGAGTGLIFILRWFWWRINALTEIVAMFVSFLVALYFAFIYPHTGLPELSSAMKLILGVGFTTLIWMLVAVFSKATDDEKLISFYKSIRPGGPGWKYIAQKVNSELNTTSENTYWDVPMAILAMIIGSLAVYSALFASGYWIYQNFSFAIGFSLLSILFFFILSKIWSKLQMD
ncbi:MAG: Na+:solute symporter [Bacteroidales bacterium]|nr:Na+:solute symporter [Bacteroidales bacterium]